MAYSELHLNKDIWIFDPIRGTEDRLPMKARTRFPSSRQMPRRCFRSDRTGPLGIYFSKGPIRGTSTAADTGASGCPEFLDADEKGDGLHPWIFRAVRNTDIYVVSVDPPDKIRPVVDTVPTKFPRSSRRMGSGLPIPPMKPVDRLCMSNRIPVRATGNGYQRGAPAEPAWSRNGSKNCFIGPGQGCSPCDSKFRVRIHSRKARHDL